MTMAQLWAEIEQRGADAERRAIVAWLRAQGANGKRGPWPHQYADAIESGQHIKGEG